MFIISRYIYCNIISPLKISKYEMYFRIKVRGKICKSSDNSAMEYIPFKTFKTF